MIYCERIESICWHCQKPLAENEVRECQRGDYPGRQLPNARGQVSVLSSTEVLELFGSDDPTLLGNRIAALTNSLGIPPCGGCEDRREWINKAHLLLRALIVKEPNP